MLEDIGVNARVFLHAEPSNAYDKHAYKVLVWKFDKLNHVGYVQRHSAVKIANIMQSARGYDNRKTYLVGRLKNRAGTPDMFEVEIQGSITDVQALVKREAAVKNDTGIFGGAKKPVEKIKTYYDQYGHQKQVRVSYDCPDQDEDRDRLGYIDEEDCF